MNCIVCGAINPDGSESCSICGAKLGVASQDGVVTNDVTGMDTATGANNMTGTTGAQDVVGTTGAQDVAGASATDVNNINGMNGAYDVTGMNSVAGAIGANNAAAAGQTGMDGGRNLGTLKGSHDVFISYSTKNKNIADAVVANFEQNGIRCWYAPRDILPGQEWVSAIKEGLHTAKVFVLIYTEESNQSRQVMNEVALAFNASKTIVPFRLTEDGMNDELEYYLTRVHWLDALSKPMSKNIDKLREYVQVILNGNTGVPASNSQTDAKDAASEKKASGAKASKKNGKKKIAIISAIACALIAAVVAGILIFGKGKGKDKKDYMALGLEAYNSDFQGTEDDAKAVEYFTKAAEKNPDAYYYLGMLSRRVSKYEEAASYFEEGRNCGSSLATVGLACCYMTGYGKYTDLGRAKELLEEALDKGCIEANLYLGEMIKDGMSNKLEDINPDAKLAMTYFEKSAESNDIYISALSYMRMGDIYRRGLAGVERDINEAAKWYNKAADRGEYFKAFAEYYKGVTYRDIDGIQAGNYFKEAKKLLEKSAGAGCLEAKRYLGFIYRWGYGVDKSFDDAMNYFEDAANNGDASSWYFMGEMWLYRDVDDEKKFSEAYKCYVKAMNLGYSRAKEAIGKLYYNGSYGKLDNGESDYTTALKYFEESIAEGNGGACSILGAMYMYGKGFDKDVKKAKNMLEKGAMLGDSESMYWLAALYKDGFLEGDKEENNKIGNEWFLKAAAAGNKNALGDIGDIYFDGEDFAADLSEEERYAKAEECWLAYIEENDNSGYYLYRLGQLYDKKEENKDNPDYSKAFKYYLKAAEAGYVDAMLEVGSRYIAGTTGIDSEGSSGKRDLTEGEKWLNKAAEQGSGEAMYYLSYIYLYREDEQWDVDKAVEYAKSAAAAGYSIASEIMTLVGECYYYGDLDTRIKQDYNKAFALFEEAATYGDADALAYLGTCYLTGRGVDKADYDKAYELLKQAEEKGTTKVVLYGSLAQYYYSVEGEKKDWAKAAKYWEYILSEKNNGADCDLDDYEYGLLAWVYVQGEDYGVTPDHKKAEKYALMGVENDENDDNNSYYVLFRLYTDDKITDIEKDYHKGYMYLIKRLNNYIQSGNSNKTDEIKKNLTTFIQKDPANAELIKKIVEELKSSGEISDKTANEVLEAIK